MRFSATSLGAGALLQLMPFGSTASGMALGNLFGRRSGEAPGPFSIVQLSDTRVGFQGPPDPLGTKASSDSSRRSTRSIPNRSSFSSPET